MGSGHLSASTQSAHRTPKAVGRNLTEAGSTQSQDRLTFTPCTFIGQHAHATHMGVAAHHARDKVLESVNEGGNTQSQVKLTFTLRANMWLDAHATHVVIAVHHICDEVVESVNVTLVYPSEMGLR